MSLTSRLFKGSQRLQACLTSDPAHVTPGDAGPHVHLIHLALMILDRLPIADGEYASRRYGPSTASAVLAYKKKRRIINKSYQQSEDNIVGKMTIASLDREMKEMEIAPLSGSERVSPICECRTLSPPVIASRAPPISRMACERIAAEARESDADSQIG